MKIKMNGDKPELYYEENIVTVPDWETRLKTLKIIVSLMNEEQKADLLSLVNMTNEEIATKIREASRKIKDTSFIRMGAAKKRYFILKRDNFTCQYCGRRAPEVILNVDHIKPVIGGGGNEDENLITSCRECNMGKGTSE